MLKESTSKELCTDIADKSLKTMYFMIFEIHLTDFHTFHKPLITPRQFLTCFHKKKFQKCQKRIYLTSRNCRKRSPYRES